MQVVINYVWKMSFYYLTFLFIVYFILSLFNLLKMNKKIKLNKKLNQLNPTIVNDDLKSQQKLQNPTCHTSPCTPHRGTL